ncbi:hypothetical protein GMOD_00002348 [Pyrenophora seminiperda CCB06]|uniref:Uncharacterized protein n=1 Tax=Pyrenophora seminiperda CCB06 TaxID=1302712 RepID=A0A3M7LXN9_9PLEO|nr:hypothetical protein GMOD_00002348 [Pyrenophora seminiperda CCB06]
MSMPLSAVDWSSRIRNANRSYQRGTAARVGQGQKGGMSDGSKDK